MRTVIFLPKAVRQATALFLFHSQVCKANSSPNMSDGNVALSQFDFGSFYRLSNKSKIKGLKTQEFSLFSPATEQFEIICGHMVRQTQHVSYRLSHRDQSDYLKHLVSEGGGADRLSGARTNTHDKAVLSVIMI